MKKPDHFLMTWRRKSGLWLQHTYARCPISKFDLWDSPVQLENLATGEILATTFGLREHAHYVTAAWPVRDKALAALERWRNRKIPKIPTKADLAAKRLKQLRTRQKEWVTSLKRGNTALRKINTAIKRLTRKFPALLNTEH